MPPPEERLTRPREVIYPSSFRPKPHSGESRMDDDREVDKLRHAVQRNRSLLDWVTDDRAREALLEMIAEDEARLHEIQQIAC